MSTIAGINGNTSAVMGSALAARVALNQEHQDSDLDLLVDLPANQSLLAVVGITQELEQLLGCPVDVAEPDSLHPLIRAEVLQHAVRL